MYFINVWSVYVGRSWYARKRQWKIDEICAAWKLGNKYNSHRMSYSWTYQLDTCAGLSHVRRLVSFTCKRRLSIVIVSVLVQQVVVWLTGLMDSLYRVWLAHQNKNIMPFLRSDWRHAFVRNFPPLFIVCFAINFTNITESCYIYLCTNGKCCNEKSPVSELWILRVYE